MKHEAIERPGEITQKAHASLRDEQLDPQEPIFSGAYIDAVSGPHTKITAHLQSFYPIMQLTPAF
jgi:hypothetical protein